MQSIYIFNQFFQYINMLANLSHQSVYFKKSYNNSIQYMNQSIQPSGSLTEENRSLQNYHIASNLNIQNQQKVAAMRKNSVQVRGEGKDTTGKEVARFGFLKRVSNQSQTMNQNINNENEASESNSNPNSSHVLKSSTYKIPKDKSSSLNNSKLFGMNADDQLSKKSRNSRGIEQLDKSEPTSSFVTDQSNSIPDYKSQFNLQQQPSFRKFQVDSQQSYSKGLVNSDHLNKAQWPNKNQDTLNRKGKNKYPDGQQQESPLFNRGGRSSLPESGHPSFASPKTLVPVGSIPATTAPNPTAFQITPSNTSNPEEISFLTASNQRPSTSTFNLNSQLKEIKSGWSGADKQPLMTEVTREEEKETEEIEEMDSDDITDNEVNIESDDGIQGQNRDTFGANLMAPDQNKAARALSMTESARTGPSRRNNEGGGSELSSFGMNTSSKQQNIGKNDTVSSAKQDSVTDKQISKPPTGLENKPSPIAVQKQPTKRRKFFSFGKRQQTFKTNGTNDELNSSPSKTDSSPQKTQNPIKQDEKKKESANQSHSSKNDVQKSKQNDSVIESSSDFSSTPSVNSRHSDDKKGDGDRPGANILNKMNTYKTNEVGAKQNLKNMKTNKQNVETIPSENSIGNIKTSFHYSDSSGNRKRSSSDSPAKQKTMPQVNTENLDESNSPQKNQSQKSILGEPVVVPIEPIKKTSEEHKSDRKKSKNEDKKSQKTDQKNRQSNLTLQEAKASVLSTFSNQSKNNQQKQRAQERFSNFRVGNGGWHNNANKKNQQNRTSNISKSQPKTESRFVQTEALRELTEFPKLSEQLSEANSDKDALQLMLQSADKNINAFKKKIKEKDDEIHNQHVQHMKAIEQNAKDQKHFQNVQNAHKDQIRALEKQADKKMQEIKKAEEGKRKELDVRVKKLEDENKQSLKKIEGQAKTVKKLEDLLEQRAKLQENAQQSNSARHADLLEQIEHYKKKSENLETQLDMQNIDHEKQLNQMVNEQTAQINELEGLLQENQESYEEKLKDAQDSAEKQQDQLRRDLKKAYSAHECEIRDLNSLFQRQIDELKKQLEKAKQQNEKQLNALKQDKAAQINELINQKDAEIKEKQAEIENNEEFSKEQINKLKQLLDKNEADFKKSIQQMEDKHDKKIKKLEKTQQNQLDDRDKKIQKVENQCDQKIKDLNKAQEVTNSRQAQKMIELTEKMLQAEQKYQEEKEKTNQLEQLLMNKQQSFDNNLKQKSEQKQYLEKTHADQKKKIQDLESVLQQQAQEHDQEIQDLQNAHNKYIEDLRDEHDNRLKEIQTQFQQMEQSLEGRISELERNNENGEVEHAELIKDLQIKQERTIKNLEIALQQSRLDHEDQLEQINSRHQNELKDMTTNMEKLRIENEAQLQEIEDKYDQEMAEALQSKMVEHVATINELEHIHSNKLNEIEGQAKTRDREHKLEIEEAKKKQVELQKQLDKYQEMCRQMEQSLQKNELAFQEEAKKLQVKGTENEQFQEIIAQMQSTHQQKQDMMVQNHLSEIQNHQDELEKRQQEHQQQVNELKLEYEMAAEKHNDESHKLKQQLEKYQELCLQMEQKLQVNEKSHSESIQKLNQDHQEMCSEMEQMIQKNMLEHKEEIEKLKVEGKEKDGFQLIIQEMKRNHQEIVEELEGKLKVALANSEKQKVEMMMEKQREYKGLQDAHDAKTQDLISDYDRILQMMKTQQDEQVAHRKATEKLLNEAEQKIRSYDVQAQEKDDIITSLQQKIKIESNHIGEIEQELEFERKMNRVQQQNLLEVKNERQRVIEDKQREIERVKEQTTKISEDISNVLSQQRQQENLRLQQLTDENNQKDSVIQQLNMSKDMLAQQNKNLEEQIQKMQIDFNGRSLVEHEIRSNNEHVLSTVRQIEFVSCQKDQQMQEMRAKLETAQRDLKNSQWSEEQLKKKIAHLSKQRVDDEENLQKLKQQICAQWILQQQKEMENDRLTRENVGLQSDIHRVQLSILENSNEINRFRENSLIEEREKFNLRQQLEKQQQENQNLSDELQKVQQQLQQERQNRRDEFGRVSQQLSNQKSQMSNYQQTIKYQNNRIESLERNQISGNPFLNSSMSQGGGFNQSQTSSVMNRPNIPFQYQQMQTQNIQPPEISNLSTPVQGNSTFRHTDSNTFGAYNPYSETQHEQASCTSTFRNNYQNDNKPKKTSRQKILWPAMTSRSPVARDSNVQSQGSVMQMPTPRLDGERCEINVQNQNDSSQLYNILSWPTRNPATTTRTVQRSTERGSSQRKHYWRNSGNDSTGLGTDDSIQQQATMSHHRMFNRTQAPWGENRGANQNNQNNGYNNNAVIQTGARGEFHNNGQAMAFDTATQGASNQESYFQNNRNTTSSQSNIDWISSSQKPATMPTGGGAPRSGQNQ